MTSLREVGMVSAVSSVQALLYSFNLLYPLHWLYELLQFSQDGNAPFGNVANIDFDFGIEG